jgi:hypothetical protein
VTNERYALVFLPRGLAECSNLTTFSFAVAELISTTFVSREFGSLAEV